MTLKEQMAGDVADLFFMLKDFGETHKIEGKPVDIVVDNDELVKLKTGQIVGTSEAGDLPERKAPGSFLNYDRRECIIIDWVENAGVSCILLHQNRTV